ncbi:MAG: hypothetical protein AAFY60_07875 [Myxococcota bacterium]
MERLTRIRDESSDWRMVCDVCWPEASEKPGYQYGGVWRAAKR